MAARDAFAFLRELPKSFTQIGAVAPSSPALARAMVRPIRKAEKPLRILEVGPGTGPFTRQILKWMRSEDELTICEINPRFLRRLKIRLNENKDYINHRSRVKFFLGPVQEVKTRFPEAKFDVIVSSLPFANFEAEMVEEILGLYESLLAEDGTVSFMEYVGIRTLGALVKPPEERERVKKVDEVLKRWCRKASTEGALRTEFTLLNLPPALTRQLKY